jgi:hypothetical protein
MVARAMRVYLTNLALAVFIGGLGLALGYSRVAVVQLPIMVIASKSFFSHNPWLIDERLTFANYIASDRPLREHRILFQVDSREEPDIVCYFNLGFSEERRRLADSGNR